MNHTNSGKTIIEEPCLVEAGQGFSVLYKNRFLYSKYSPQKAMMQTVEQLKLLPQTLVLCFSPCLWYGLKELLEKLPDQSLILGVEADKYLFRLAQEKLKDIKTSFPTLQDKVLLTSSEKIEELVKHLPPFRRVCILEMSGGTYFFKPLYSEISRFIQNFVASFWKNRITLVKLGRLFCRNFFKNLKAYPAVNSVPSSSPFFFRPFIVFGAGQSTESFLSCISEETLKKCTLVAVDAALPVLLKHKIQPDFIIAVEAQLAIEKAYIGTGHLRSAIISDLSARPEILLHTKGRHLYFYSEFSEGVFFKQAEAKKILPTKIPPLGSVGLTAVFLSIFMRFNKTVPIFVTGLDFSYTTGFTHARGAPAHTARLLSSGRFKPVENYEAAYKIDAKTVSGKNCKVITDTALRNYADLFVNFFQNTPSLYDAGISGLKLGLPSASTEQIENFCSSLSKKTEDEYSGIWVQDKANTEKIEKATALYLKSEKAALLRIKELLSKGEKSLPPPVPGLKEELSSLLCPREYLYLHFPDGHQFTLENLSILKRIRNEIDFFLKNFD